MHVDEAGDDRLAGQVDDLGPLRSLHAGRRPDRRDLVADHQHRVIGQPLASLDIEDPGVGQEHPGRGRAVGVRLCQRGVPGAVQLLLLVDQRTHRVLPSLGHERRVGGGGSEPGAVLVHPRVLHRQLEPGDGIADQLARLPARAHRHLGDLLDARLTRGQERDLAAVRHRRRDQEPVDLRHGRHRHEERRPADRLLPLLLLALPARAAIAERERLGDLGAHLVLARRRQRRDRPVRRQPQRRVNPWPAPVLQDEQRRADGAIGGRRHSRRPGLARAEDDDPLDLTRRRRPGHGPRGASCRSPAGSRRSPGRLRARHTRHHDYRESQDAHAAENRPTAGVSQRPGAGLPATGQVLPTCAPSTRRRSTSVSSRAIWQTHARVAVHVSQWART